MAYLGIKKAYSVYLSSIFHKIFAVAKKVLTKERIVAIIV